MGKQYVLVGVILGLTLVFAVGLFWVGRDQEKPLDGGAEVVRLAPVDEVVDPAPVVVIEGEASGRDDDAEVTPFTGEEPDVTVQYPEGLEGIKQQVYDLNVEYIEDLAELEVMGRVTDKPPGELWQGEWVSVDDWKRRSDGFRIAQREDGTYALFPEGEASEAYAWDEERGEFSWDLDYYGKVITRKARFIDENVLLLMTISGRKVALDIYSKAE